MPLRPRALGNDRVPLSMMPPTGRANREPSSAGRGLGLPRERGTMHAHGGSSGSRSDARPVRRAASVPPGHSGGVGRNVEGVLRSIKEMQDQGKPSYAQALVEIQMGRKRSHWIWYVWPSLAVLRPGTSRPMFLLPNLQAARFYLRDEVLSARLAEITEVAISHFTGGLKPQILFGSSTDASKFIETMTFFAIAAAENRDIPRLQLCVSALQACSRDQLDRRALDAVVAEGPGMAKYSGLSLATQLLPMAETTDALSSSGRRERPSENQGLRRNWDPPR